MANIESSALRYAAGAAPVRVTPSLTVSSPATGTLAGATVTVSSGFTAGQDALAFAGQSGITGSYSASTGVLTFTGTATVPAYAQVLRSVTYRDTDAAARYGTRAISFQVSDGEPDHSLSNVVSRAVLVTAKPPIAVSDKATTGKNAPVTISVLANDTDPAGLPLTIASVTTTGTKGIVTIDPGGMTVIYNPNGQFAGLAAGKTATDKFTYQATDGTQTSNSATVTVTITGSSSAPQPPTVVAHPYKAVGNTPLGVGTAPAAPAATVSGTVLSGDSDPDPTATLTVTANTQPAHGTVTVNPDGTFTYLPNPGYTGADTFQATIAGSNAPAVTATETVTITVGTVVWYVNNSGSAPGNGTAASPFSTLAAASTAAGAGSIVFLYQGDAEYTGGVTMQPGEDLFGQPHGLTADGYSLVPAGGSAPDIINEDGDGIDLAEGADVEGVSVTCASGNGIAAANVNDATVGATAPVSVSGAAVDGILVTHGDGTMNFGGTSVTGSAEDAVDVSNRGGGTVTFGGPISGTGGGIYLEGNAVTTAIGFAGTLTLDPAPGNPAFYGYDSGTVTVTGPGSTLSSTGAGALTADAIIGPAGMTFQSVSGAGGGAGIEAGGGEDDGRLTVTGTGTPGSGGTIQGAPGIQLGSAYDPGFTDMVIEGTDGDGIAGTVADGLTLDRDTVSGSSDPADGDAPSWGLDFPATGNVSITNSAISDASIPDEGGTLNLTVAGTTFGGGGTPGALSVAAVSTAIGSTVISSANVTVSVTGSVFNAGDSYDAFLFSSLLSDSGPGGGTPSPGAGSVTFTGNTVSDGGTDIVAGTGTVCADIAGNTITGPGASPAGIDLRQEGSATIELPGYTGSPAGIGAVESFLTGGNNISGTPAAVAAVSGNGGGFVGVTGC